MCANVHYIFVFLKLGFSRTTRLRTGGVISLIAVVILCISTKGIDCGITVVHNLDDFLAYDYT